MIRSVANSDLGLYFSGIGIRGKPYRGCVLLIYVNFSFTHFHPIVSAAFAKILVVIKI